MVAALGKALYDDLLIYANCIKPEAAKLRLFRPLTAALFLTRVVFVYSDVV